KGGLTQLSSSFLLTPSGLVKAVNTAVDLIVAHFGTSRDPDVKAKLGNSWVSPNVGHLILKYLCPALHEVLQDGLKAYVLDLIIGQRRCRPWSLAEASTQPGEEAKKSHTRPNHIIV
uniref:RUN domain-containing protein n=1 Tax=Cyclopterus lumpus TaxID=8103 RepID=A0A8C2XSD8_CYCLU